MTLHPACSQALADARRLIVREGVPGTVALIARFLSTADGLHDCMPTLAAAAGDYDGLSASARAAIDDTLQTAVDTWSRDNTPTVDIAEKMLVSLRYGEMRGQRRRVRRRTGEFYTPPWLASWLSSKVLDAVPTARNVGDPACGCGAFLVAAIGNNPELTVWGVDSDPLAVEICRSRLAARGVAWDRVAETIIVGDGLTTELPPLDVALSNPPFGSAIPSDTRRDNLARETHRELFPEIAVGAYDQAWVFLARMIDLLVEGGRYGAVIPRSMVSISSADAMRRMLDDRAPPELLWTPPSSALFDGADVYVAMIAGRRLGETTPRPTAIEVSGEPPLEGGAPEMRTVEGPIRAPQWSILVAPGGDLLTQVIRIGQPTIPLGEAFDVFAGAATGAAYNLRDVVIDDEDGAGLKLVTTGLIDPYVSRWGAVRCRFLHRELEFPRWPETTTGALDKAAARQRQPKVLVAGLTRILEAVADPDGELGGVVSTWVMLPAVATEDSVHFFAALLNSPLMTLSYMARYSGKQLTSGSTTIGKRELVKLPVFEDVEALAHRVSSQSPDMVDPFSLSPNNLEHRLRLASQAASAAKFAKNIDAERGGVRAARAISRLFGIDHDLHERIARWYHVRQPSHLTEED